MRSWLLAIRQGKNKSHEDVATECNITRQFYSMLESGERNPSVEVAKKIANTLEFQWTKFYEDNTESSQ